MIADAEAGDAGSHEAAEALDNQIALVSELKEESERLVSEAESAAAKADERISQLEAELADADLQPLGGGRLEQAETSVVVPEIHTDSSEGTSLRDRIDAAENEPMSPAEDSLDAIRDEAMRALEEARSLKDHSSTDPDTTLEISEMEPPGSTAPILDYSPSVPAPVSDADADADADESEGEEEAENLDDLVQSRYSRNSAKLPRLGIEPGDASSTIANLRKQMTVEG